MSSNWSRRDLMKFLGVGSLSGALQSPMELLIDSMITGMVTEAVANETGKRAKNYIFVQQHGAPPRWMYDLFINPNNDSKFVASKAVGSEFKQVGSVYEGVHYQGHLLKGGKYWGPRIWTHEVAKAGGGTRRMDDLMDNMLVIQGIDTGNAGHDSSAQLINNPFTPVSLGGAVADLSPTPITSLSMGSRSQLYKSRLGKSRKELNMRGNPLQNLLSPFDKRASEQMLSVEKSVSSRLIASVSELNKYHKLSFSGSKSISVDQENAINLMTNQIDDLGTKWNALVDKYEDIIRRTMDMSGSGLAGYSDRSIGLADMSQRDNDIYKFGDRRVTNGDLRTAITSSLSVSVLASRFAVTEYVIVNGLSSYVGMNIGGTTGLQFNLDGSSNLTRSNMGNDQHGVGAAVSLLSNVLMYRCISACILGLIDSLKAAPGFSGQNLFDDSVIRVTGEFGRSPRGDGTGSDHAPQATTNSIYSGSIKGLTITGNVTATPVHDSSGYQNRYPASWGTASKTSVFGGRAVNPGNLVSSISTLLGVEPISVNNPSLVSVDSEGKVNSILGDSELVDE